MSMSIKRVVVSSASFRRSFVRAAHNGRNNGGSGAVPGTSPPYVPRAPTSYRRGWPAGAPIRPMVAHFDPFPDDPHDPAPLERPPEPDVDITAPIKVDLNKEY